jgi:hypothetical protein
MNKHLHRTCHLTARIYKEKIKKIYYCNDDGDIDAGALTSVIRSREILREIRE